MYSRISTDSGQSFTIGSNFYDIFPGNNKMLSYKTIFKNLHQHRFVYFAKINVVLHYNFELLNRAELNKKHASKIN